MCGRLTLSWDDHIRLAEELEARLGADEGSLHRPRYNIAPTQPHWLVSQQGGTAVLRWGRWGLVNAWARDTKRAAQQINARAERVAEAPSYREAFRSRRCIIPVDGYYEWSGPDKRPVWFHAAAGGLLRLAGLHAERRDPESQVETTTFTILTTEANTMTSAFHHRMPVILDRAGAAAWIDDTPAARLHELMCPAEDHILKQRWVGRAVGNVRNDGPTLIEHADTEPRQLTLLP